MEEQLAFTIRRPSCSVCSAASFDEAIRLSDAFACYISYRSAWSLVKICIPTMMEDQQGDTGMIRVDETQLPNGPRATWLAVHTE